jgi:hypothetical protein
MVRTTRFLLPALILIAVFSVNSANAQTVSFKNFNSFQDIVPGVDFFASNRQAIAPYEEASAQAMAKLKTLFPDEELPKGAIFICSTQAQRDSLYEPVVMRRGYSWVLISTTPEMRINEQLDRMKSQMGDNIPAEMQQRLNASLREAAATVDPQTVSNMTRNIAWGVLQAMMNDENFQFRASRVEDVVKSPLVDWLDVAIGAYVSGDRSPIRYLQENIDIAFPLEDVLFMARPFVASTTTGSNQRGGGGGPGGGGPGGGMVVIMGGDGPGGGGQGGRQGGQGAPKSKPEGGGQPQRTLSKDEQDRMLFDGQAISFFDYFMEKFGIEKIRELISFSREGNESWNFVVRPDLLGRDFAKIEPVVNEWLMKQSIPAAPKPKAKIQQ